MKNYAISEDQIKKIVEEIQEAPAKYSHNAINVLLSLHPINILPAKEDKEIKEDKEVIKP